MTHLQACPRWATMIAARHPQDITPTERASLNAHLATCAGCAATAIAYERMQQSIHTLPPVQPLLTLSVARVQQKERPPMFWISLLDAMPWRTNYRLEPAFATPTSLQRARWQVNASLATVLVAVVVFVSISAILLSSRWSNSSGSSMSGGSPASGVTSPWPSQSVECPLDVDAGLHYVCQHGLYQMLSQAHIVGNYKIVLHAAFADENRIAVSYQLLKKQKDDRYTQGLEGENGLYSFVSLAYSGHNLKEQGSTGFLNQKSGIMYGIQFFQTPSLPGTEGSRQINVRFHSDGVIEYTTNLNKPIATSPPTDFNFTLNVDLAHKLLVLNQMVVSKGIPMTLESVSITSTSVIMRFNYKQPHETLIVTDFRALGVNIKPDPFASFDNQDYVGPGTFISFNGSLLNRNGLWTLTMQQRPDGAHNAPEPPIDPNHVWKFQFTVH